MFARWNTPDLAGLAVAIWGLGGRWQDRPCGGGSLRGVSLAIARAPDSPADPAWLWCVPQPLKIDQADGSEAQAWRILRTRAHIPVGWAAPTQPMRQAPPGPPRGLRGGGSEIHHCGQWRSYPSPGLRPPDDCARPPARTRAKGVALSDPKSAGRRGRAAPAAQGGALGLRHVHRSAPASWPQGAADVLSAVTGRSAASRPPQPRSGPAALRALRARPAASGLTRPTVHAEGLA
jgi:hypothetical protein